MRKLIAGNWKMNGVRADIAQAERIAHAVPGSVDVALCVPATILMATVERCAMSVGAQDCHMAASGAYTGSISAQMIADAGGRLVIVGHSERRDAMGESDADIAAKTMAAQAAGLDVIVCCGESRAIRDAGDAERFVLAQLDGSLPADADPRRLAIAYEPIWAIGTGLVPTMADIGAMHAAIRRRVIAVYGEPGASVRILYGGSVNGDNAAELLSIADVDGALVGGASLTADKFLPIVDAAAQLAGGAA